jgi:methyl-accepting chemotaxis protein
VNKGLAFAGRIAEGDLTGRIDVDRDDELGMLGKSLNSAADSLAALISSVISASQNLAQAVEQITSGNQNLSQRTSEQASSLEEIASTIEQATAAINQNADNAADARKLSAASLKMAEEGGRLVSDAVASINQINSTSKKIGEIISVINEITFQTNLLALNASVEAARAGEQGRGFAVVAGEVRNLAQRSGGAAKEITELIKGSLEMIETGTQKANKSGDALKKIIESINNVDSVIVEIAEATNEQKAGITQINLAVSEMDSMTQQNAALVEETASAGESMAGQAQELLAMVRQFRISDGGRYETTKKIIQEKSPVPMKKYTARTPEKIKKVPEKTEPGFAATELEPGPEPDATSAPVGKPAPAAKPATRAKPAAGPVDSTDKALMDDGFEKF